MVSASATTICELAVRSEPRCSVAESARLAAGMPFEILGNDGAWWYIRADSREGFVNAAYTRCAQHGHEPLWTTRVAIDALSLRDRPALRAETLWLLEQDEQLSVLGFVVAPGGTVWLCVARDGLRGFVSAERTCRLPPKVPTTQPESMVLRRLLLAARQSQLETQTPVAVTLAQAIVESNWGLSPPSERNNLLHLKATPCLDGSYSCGPIATGYMLATATEWRNGRMAAVPTAFRTYASLKDGVRDHGLFLRSDPRFAAAFRYCKEPAAFARTIAAAEYASDPHYADKLLTQIETYRLTQYER